MNAHAIFALVGNVEPDRLALTHRDGLEPHVAQQLEWDVVGALVEARLEHGVLARRQPVDRVEATLVRRGAAQRAALHGERRHDRIGERPLQYASDVAFDRAARIERDLDR